MVKLTRTFIEKKCLESYSNKSLTKEMDKNHLEKITHLFMNGKCISNIENISICKNLRVVYLQNNNITKIENLEFAENLTHLYLQHNKLKKIENLNTLRNLQQLYLGYNNISVIEGLEKLTKLLELHVEKQHLKIGERLCFEPRTVLSLSDCLRYLNIEGNGVTTLCDISNLRQLRSLHAKHNEITNIETLSKTISNLHNLTDLSLQGNPVTKVHRYRENLIANSNSLLILDDKQISENSRTFLKRFKLHRKIHQERKKHTEDISEDISNSLNLPPAFKKSISRVMFQPAGPKLSISVLSATNEFQPQYFPAWKSAMSVKGLKNNRVIPRPYWRSVALNKMSTQSSATKFPLI